MEEIKGSKKETLLYIGGFELPDKNAAAHRVLSNGKLFKKLGYNVVFLGITKQRKEEESFSLIQGFQTWTIQYPQKKIDWLNYLISIKNIKQTISKYERVTTIVAYNYPAFALYRLRKYCKENKIKLIADCTEWYSASKDNLIFYTLKNLDSNFRMKFLHPKMDALIVISSYLENYYSQFSIKIANLPPLVDKSEQKWEKINYKTDSKKLQFVYAGSPGESKDKLNYLVEALKEIDREKYEFKIIGITVEEYLKKYPLHSECLRNLNIKFLGKLSHLEALTVIKKSDFTLFIRDINRVTLAGFPTKFVESLSCGIPVITNSSSDLKNYLVNNINGFLLEEDFEKNLKEIFKKNYIDLKNMKLNIEETKFDYNNYKDELKKIL